MAAPLQAGSALRKAGVTVLGQGGQPGIEEAAALLTALLRLLLRGKVQEG